MGGSSSSGLNPHLPLLFKQKDTYSTFIYNWLWKNEGFKKNNLGKIIWVPSVHSQTPLENKCFQVLLGVKDEVSLMAWANKFYTLGISTATLRLPPCPRAISTCGASAAPGRCLANIHIPPGPMPLGTWIASRANFRSTCCSLGELVSCLWVDVV